MSLYDQSLLAYDADFNARTSASVSNETPDVHPESWTAEHRWEMAAAPGFADKYASALASGVDHPGRDQAVINDGEILSAVQAILAREAEPEA